VLLFDLDGLGLRKLLLRRYLKGNSISNLLLLRCIFVRIGSLDSGLKRRIWQGWRGVVWVVGVIVGMEDPGRGNCLDRLVENWLVVSFGRHRLIVILRT